MDFALFYLRRRQTGGRVQLDRPSLMERLG